MSDDLEINGQVTIPAGELEYRASRSGGPGGQHVNTSSTRVEVIWNVDTTTALTEQQRARVRERLASRLTSDGSLILAGSSHRSQHRNREEVTERLAEVVREALHVPKPRKRTKPTRASKERRLQSKKRRSEKKRLRGPVTRD